MELIAHLTKNGGIRKEETLKEHCIKTADYAVQSIGYDLYQQNVRQGLLCDITFQKQGIYFWHIICTAAEMHDIGKARCKYVSYLENAFLRKGVIKGLVNHTFAGVQWFMESFHTVESSLWEKMTSEIIAFAVGSHHGLFDCVDLNGNNGFLYRQQKDKNELDYEETVQNYFDQVMPENVVVSHFQKAVTEVKNFYDALIEEYGKNKSAICFQLGMLARLVLSAVIYGDRRDTCEFMNQRKLDTDSSITWKDRRIYFEDKLGHLSSDSEINQVRKEISLQCAGAGRKCPGIYRLNVPTGGGKTLSTFRLAMQHAENYHKKRIIFIIPLLSVLDQNVKVIRAYMLDPEAVLEHHSNVICEKNDGDDLDQWEFPAESWNSPVVVSTLVQLLNILFSHKTSAIARMQALCDSVIVIDEVQTLPKRITLMFNMALNFLQKYCNATIILSSATQPCFEELKWPLHMAEEPELVRLDRQQLRAFRRSKIVIDRKHPYGMDWDECTGFCSELMEKHDSLLVICNTKMEAQILFRRMQKRAESRGWEVYHLSKSMCQEHRSDALNEILEKLSILQNGDRETAGVSKIVCIATQVVEAGVDFSFDGVVRVIAGIDNLIQSAGRCNRSNEYGYMGTVYLISLKYENLCIPDEIRIAQLCTRKVLDILDTEDDDCIVGEEAVQKFYQYLYQETEKETAYPVKISGQLFYLTRLLANQNAYGNVGENRNYFFRQPFKTVGENFKVFDNGTVDVIAPYKKGIDLIQKLMSLSTSEAHCIETKKIIRQSGRYSISLDDFQRKRLEDAKLLTPILDGRACILEEKAYDDTIGLIL